MNDNKIIINGKSENLSVDTSKNIIVNWSKLMQQQKLFRVIVKDNDVLIFDSNVIEGKQPFLDIKLPYSLVRKQYEVILEIFTVRGKKKLFTTTFYSSNDNLKNASWITRLDNPIEKEWKFFADKPNIILQKSFQYSGLVNRVFLDICGLGYYSVKINNVLIDDSILNSDVTNYSEIVYYDTYSIEKFLKVGENTISVELANGWYNPAPIKILGKYNVRNRLPIGKPCLICQLSYTDDDNNLITINSDNSWENITGKYLFNSLFIGEKIDSSSRSSFKMNNVVEKTVKIAGPSGKLVPSHIPKIKRVKKYYPKEVYQENNKVFIDFGRIISGQFSCKITKDLTGSIVMYYSEAKGSDGDLDFKSCISGTYGQNVQDKGIKENDPVIQMDQIIKDNEEVSFENKFIYHSFRYVTLESQDNKLVDLKNVVDIYAYSVHTDLDLASSFTSSCDDLNTLWEAAIQTKLNNIHSIFEDCARERLGYGGDIVALLDSQVYSFDLEQLLLKVFKDFTNEQASNGSITQTAPYIGIQTNGPSDKAGSLGWQLVYPIIIQKLEKHYFQPSVINDHIDSLLAHVNYLLKFDFDYIKYCCLGDWGSIDSKFKDHLVETPDQEFCSSVMYFLILNTYKNIFSKVSYGEVSSKINNKLEEVRDLILAEFYNEAGYFQTGSQSSFAFALHANLIKGNTRYKVLKNFIEKIKRESGIFRLGIFGVSWTYKILSSEMHDDLILSWLLRKEQPSFLYMLSKNNNVLSEYFDDKLGSLNHAMFSSYTSWMMERILGIEITEHAHGSNVVRISPYFPDKMSYANGKLNTIRGLISANWVRAGENIEMQVLIPESMTYDLKFDHNRSLSFINEIEIEPNYTKLEMIITTNQPCI